MQRRLNMSWMRQILKGSSAVLRTGRNIRSWLLEVTVKYQKLAFLELPYECGHEITPLQFLLNLFFISKSLCHAFILLLKMIKLLSSERIDRLKRFCVISNRLIWLSEKLLKLWQILNSLFLSSLHKWGPEDAKMMSVAGNRRHLLKNK